MSTDMLGFRSFFRVVASFSIGLWMGESAPVYLTADVFAFTGQGLFHLKVSGEGFKNGRFFEGWGRGRILNYFYHEIIYDLWILGRGGGVEFLIIFRLPFLRSPTLSNGTDFTDRLTYGMLF